MQNNNFKLTDNPIPDYLPKDDKSFYIEHFKSTGFKARIKSAIRNLLYPVLTDIKDSKLSKLYDFKSKYGLNKLFWGSRGTDYNAMRKLVNQHMDIEGKTVLILGCGIGKDIESWYRFKPKRVIGLEYFNYKNAWQNHTEYLSKKYPDTETVFVQGDINNMVSFYDESIDIIGSDAVFEHLNNFDAAISEIKRVLIKGGIVYANFGPLWHCYGGDHLSAEKGLENSYNHLLLDENNYKTFLDSFGQYNHDDVDGRTWIYNNLFSYLTPEQYFEKMDSAGLLKEYAAAILEPSCLSFKEQYPDKYKILEEKYGFDALFIFALILVYRKI